MSTALIAFCFHQKTWQAYFRTQSVDNEFSASLTTISCVQMDHFMIQLLCTPYCCSEDKAFLSEMPPKRAIFWFPNFWFSCYSAYTKFTLSPRGLSMIFDLLVRLLLFFNWNVIEPLIYCDQMASIVRMEPFDHLSQSIYFPFVFCTRDRIQGFSYSR